MNTGTNEASANDNAATSKQPGSERAEQGKAQQSKLEQQSKSTQTKPEKEKSDTARAPSAPLYVQILEAAGDKFVPGATTEISEDEKRTAIEAVGEKTSSPCRLGWRKTGRKNCMSNSWNGGSGSSCFKRVTRRFRTHMRQGRIEGVSPAFPLTTQTMIRSS